MIKEDTDKTDTTATAATADTTDKTDKSTSNIYDNCNHVILFHNTLLKFLTYMLNVFKGNRRNVKLIKKAIKYYSEYQKRDEYIKLLNSRLEPHREYISRYDEGIFSDDYNTGSMKLVPGLDFKLLFKYLYTEEGQNEFKNVRIHATKKSTDTPIEDTDTHIEDTTNNTDIPIEDADTISTEDTILSIKKSIFNNFQRLYIISTLAIAQIDKFNRVMHKQEKILLNMIDNLNIDQDVKEKLKHMKNDDDEDDTSGIDMTQLQDLLGEDNLLINLAKDISNDLNIDKELEDKPMETIKALFANDGKKIRELIVKVTDKLQSKIKSGEVSEKDIRESAVNMKSKMSKITSKFKGPTKKVAEEMRKHGFDVPENIFGEDAADTADTK